MDNRRMPEHGYTVSINNTISSPCESNCSGELKKEKKKMNLHKYEVCENSLL